MNLKDLIEETKARPPKQNQPKGEPCKPPHGGETCSEHIARIADDLIAESEGAKPRPNQKVIDMLDEYQAKLHGIDWSPPFPEIYQSKPKTPTQGGIDNEKDPDPFEQAHRDMGF